MRKLAVLGSVVALMLATGCSKNKSAGSSSGSSGATTSGTGTSAGSGSTGTTSSGTTSSGTGSGSSSGSGGTSGSSGSTGDAGETSLDAGLLEYCAGHGAPVSVGDSLTDGGSSATCAGNLAQRTFRFALCTCDALTVNQHLNTSSFIMQDAGFPDGGSGLVMVTGRKNASIGIDNGILTSAQNAQLNVGGSLFDSDGGISAHGPISVAGELHAGSLADSLVSSSVGRDAYCAQDCTGNWNIGGDLYQLTCPAVGPTVHGDAGCVPTSVNVADPCDCSNLVDIAGIVAAHQSNNDNGQIGLVDPDAGFGDAGLDPTLFSSGTFSGTFDFPCGRYYLTSSTDGGPAVDVTGGGITWNIQGRTAIMIDGDMNIPQSGGGLTINVPQGSELDLFIGGNLSIGATSTFGSQDNVSGTRIYVGGSQPISLTTPVNIYANIYAPFATFQTTNPLDVYGSLFVKELINNSGGTAQGGNINIYYDEAVLQAGTECVTPAVDAGFEVVDAGFYDDGGAVDGGVVAVDAGPQPQSCSTCSDCNNQACNVPGDGGPGVCGACTTSADCCAPLVCTNGACTVVFQ